LCTYLLAGEGLRGGGAIGGEGAGGGGDPRGAVAAVCVRVGVRRRGLGRLHPGAARKSRVGAAQVVDRRRSSNRGAQVGAHFARLTQSSS